MAYCPPPIRPIPLSAHNKVGTEVIFCRPLSLPFPLRLDSPLRACKVSRCRASIMCGLQRRRGLINVRAWLLFDPQTPVWIPRRGAWVQARVRPGCRGQLGVKDTQALTDRITERLLGWSWPLIKIHPNSSIPCPLPRPLSSHLHAFC